jgi:DNA-binding transcriptional LysR family regulator
MLLIATPLCNYSRINQAFDWSNLKAFLVVMRIVRLTAAAKLMKIDHSTRSHRIVRLEAALQTRLFDRLTVRGIVQSRLGRNVCVKLKILNL